MSFIDAIAAPIRELLDGVGTGVMSAAGPSTQLRSTATQLDHAAQQTQTARGVVGAAWDSDASTNAQSALGEHLDYLDGSALDSRAIADVTDHACAVIADASRQLRAILDSFVQAADALGPAAYTPMGVMSLMSTGAVHLLRALEVVSHAQSQLQALESTLSQHTHRPRPRDRATDRSDADNASTKTPIDPGSATGSPASSPIDPGSATGSTAIRLPDGSVAHAPNARAATAVRAALSQQGVPYQWGGTTPGKGLDCSGLTQYAYRKAGVELPRLAQEQDTAGFRVDQAEVAPGDLAVWSGHVAMIVGNGQMIEAGDPVSVTPIRTSNAGDAFEGFFRPR